MRQSEPNFPEDEVERRRDATLLRARSTRHERQKEMKIGKGAGS